MIFLLQGNGKVERIVMRNFLKEARIEAQVRVCKYIHVIYYNISGHITGASSD